MIVMIAHAVVLSRDLWATLSKRLLARLSRASVLPIRKHPGQFRLSKCKTESYIPVYSTVRLLEQVLV